MREGAPDGAFFWLERVYFDSTDSGGVVYHANYLTFMERARTEWLRHLGFEQTDLAEARGVLFVVSRVNIDYLTPARFNDRLCVSVVIREIGRSRIDFEQEIYRGERPAADGKPLSRAAVTIACVDSRTFRPTRIPAPMLAKIRGD